MRSTTLTLVRHGAIDRTLAAGARHDPPLTPTGRAEVLALRARLLASPPPQAIVRSPARRAEVTADLLGWSQATVDPAWSERDLGAWEGRPWTELWDEAPHEVQHDPAAFAAFTPPCGEPTSAVRERVAAAIAALPAVDHVAVVCHAGPITAALALALDLDTVTSLRVRVPTGSLTRLTRYGDGTLTVEAVGA